MPARTSMLMPLSAAMKITRRKRCPSKLETASLWRLGRMSWSTCRKNFGGCTQRMKEAIGVTGEVVRVSKGGSVYVNFIPMGQYRFNPKALVKVIQVREGQLVRIRPDKDQVKILNRRVGWKDEMTNTVGQVGRVIKLDEKGVVAISFGNSEFCYTYTKACCLPAHGAPQDSHNCGTSGRDTKLFPVSVVLLCGSEYIAKDEDSKTLSRALKKKK
ncbi:E3 ubiquitin-protein ligase MIB2-like [Pomacea canaliculata]|uniref:E3 ubiquitin-protein ligase MIB2-like n=1 Tax=Pomacea canaliculata TaxID=400727 RepID=UPI000D72B1D1|nr:E3 ubiquitin-protein ligase MIB2-like [Pomacea canaliculata]